MILFDKIEPNRRELKTFGILMAVFISVLFGVILPVIGERPYPAWPFIISSAVLVSGFILPVILTPLFYFWIFFGRIIGQINLYILMSIIYFFVFSPVAFFFKLTGKDPMKRAFDRNAVSYRETCEQKTKDHMKRPY